jgi:hypothetical protein
MFLQTESTTPMGAKLKRNPLILQKTDADLAEERAEVQMYQAIRDEQIMVGESPTGSVVKRLFIPFWSSSLDSQRYADVDDTLPAPDAEESQDDEGGDVRRVQSDDQDEEMDDDTLASAPSIPRLRPIGSVASGSGLSVSDVSRNLRHRGAESLERVAELRELIRDGLEHCSTGRCVRNLGRTLQRRTVRRAPRPLRASPNACVRFAQ